MEEISPLVAIVMQQQRPTSSLNFLFLNILVTLLVLAFSIFALLIVNGFEYSGLSIFPYYSFIIVLWIVYSLHKPIYNHTQDPSTLYTCTRPGPFLTFRNTAFPFQPQSPYPIPPAHLW